MRSRVISADLSPKKLKGNNQVLKCFARSLGNCRGNISREHYISETLLERFDSIPAAGIPWLSHVHGNIKPKALVANCLCEGHNNYLSPLDNLAGNVFDEILDFGTGTEPGHIKIEGKSFERWLLKCLFGLLATGQFVHNEQTFDESALSQDWLRVLFGYQEFPKGLGMYGRFNVGDTINFEKRVRLAPTWLNQAPCGMSVLLGGLDVVVILIPKDQAFVRTHPDYDNFLYRPAILNRPVGKSERKLQFYYSQYERDHRW